MSDNNNRRTLPDHFSKSDACRSPNRILQTKYAESFSHFMEQVQFRTPLKSGRLMFAMSWPYCILMLIY